MYLYQRKIVFAVMYSPYLINDEIKANSYSQGAAVISRQIFVLLQILIYVFVLNFSFYHTR